MPSQPSSGPFVADMRRQANLGTVWSAIKWGGFAALFFAGGAFAFLASLQDGRGFTGSEAQWMCIFWATVGAIGLFFVVRTAKRRLSSGSHPLDKEFSAFGEPAAIARAIEAAFIGRTFAPRRSQIAGGWFCYVGRHLTIVRRLDRLVWAYRLRVWHLLNRIIPYRVSNDLMLWSRDGSGTAIPGSKARLGRALEDLRAAAPWLPIGYSAAIKETWNSDRAEFIAAVDQVRKTSTS